MTRLIYTIHFSPKELGINLSTYEKAEPLDHNAWMMIDKQKEYATRIGVDYQVIRPGEQFYQYLADTKEKLEIEDDYQVIQHYKHFLMEQFTQEFDEVLYLDLDVLPLGSQNIFNEFDLNQGLPTHGFIDDKQENIENLAKGYLSYLPKPRSVCVKQALMASLCVPDIEINIFTQPVYNTGIMLSNKHYSNQIDYTNSLLSYKQKIDQIKSQQYHFFADYIQEQYTVNNESIFSAILHQNNIKTQPFAENWHYVHNHRNYADSIPTTVNLIHFISKRFDYARISNSFRQY